VFTSQEQLIGRVTQTMESEGPILIGNGVTKPSDAVDVVRNLCNLTIPTTLHSNLLAFSCAMAKYLEEAAEQSKMVIYCNTV
jgi:hypothetical protein